MLHSHRLTAAVAMLAMSGCTEPPRSIEKPPWDDDTMRLGHCEFVPAPIREARPPPQPQPLYAGYGNAILVMPIGTPLAAYGDRVVALGNSDAPDARAARWATAMTPSVGVVDPPRAEALALRSGDDEPLLFMRVDAGFITEAVLFSLEASLADVGNFRGRILLTASHSHAAWGAWMPTMHLVPGADASRRELLDRAVTAMRRAAVEALDGLQPAKIGIAVDRAFDAEDQITRDRRSENDGVVGPDGNRAGQNKDPIAWALRVDDMNGDPIVGVVNLPIHGTVGGGANPLAGTDAPGAIQRSLSAVVGYPIMHVQGAAGDVTPAVDGGRGDCVDATRCYDLPRLEVLGARAANLLAPLLKQIDTARDVAFEMVTRSFPVGRGGVVDRPDGRQLYYLPPDEDALPDFELFADDGLAASPFDEFNTVAGAGLCGSGSPAFSPLPGVIELPPPYNSCLNLDEGADVVLGIFEMETPILPECGSVRATGGALRISGLPGGDWLMVGVPGEPTAPFAHYLRSRSPAADRTLLIGYADEYTGYVMTAEDWLSGGYECSTNIWGPREGEQVLDGVLAAAEIAWTPQVEDPEDGTTRFEAFDVVHEQPIMPLPTASHGTPLEGAVALWWPDAIGPAMVVPGTDVERAVGVARFAWRGGDPAVDFPHAVIERSTDDGTSWQPVTGVRGTPASSHHGVVVVTYAPEPLTSETPEAHHYGATWQPAAVDPLSDDAVAPFALPLGLYRIRVTGRALAPSGSIEAYEAASAGFAVVAASLSEASQATVGAATLDVDAWVGPAPGLRALGVGMSDGLIPLPGPWDVELELDDGSKLSMSTVPDGPKASLPINEATLQRVVSATVRDPAGNGGLLLLSD